MARLAFAMAALIGAIALGNAAIAANAGVAMRGAQFAPGAVTVNVGDSVTWTNEDGIPHSARADNGSFDTGVFSTGARSVTFAQAGTFGYFCVVHPSTMRGTVNVLGAATPPPPTPPPPTPPPPTPPPPTAPPPTAAPTARPSPPPPTSVPSTPSPSPVPSTTASPAPTPSEAPTAAASATAVALQVSPTPSATATPDGSSRSGDGAPPLLLIGAIAAVLALAGGAFALSRRG